MKVWILQTGEPLPCDGEKARPMRAMNLANELIRRNHEVTIWSSDFYHQEKRHRFGITTEVSDKVGLRTRLLGSSGYSANIGLARLIDHYQMARQLSRWLDQITDVPDVAFIGYPPIEVAYVMTKWLKKRNVPMMLDVKDQWPQIFVGRAPSFLKPLVRVAVDPYFRLAKIVFTNATHYSAMSSAFLDWACQFAERSRTERDLVVPLTTPKRQLSSVNSLEADQWWMEQGVDVYHRNVISFIGSLSAAFDFRVVADAARRCQDDGVIVRFVICGDGAEANSIKALMVGLNNVVMPGWIDGDKIQSLAKATLATLAPYRNTLDFQLSIPNKILDSLCNGLPILTTLHGEVSSLVQTNHVGYYGSESDSRWLVQAIRELLDNDTWSAAMRERALQLYESQFDCNKIYGDLVTALGKLCKSPPIVCLK